MGMLVLCLRGFQLRVGVGAFRGVGFGSVPLWAIRP